MSPSSKPTRRFRDIVDNIVLIEADTGGMSPNAFLANRTVQDAVLFRLLRISEAATKLGAAAEQIAPDQPWAQIRSFGNVLRHQYDDVELSQVWTILKRDLPRLRAACEHALTVEGPE